MPNATKEDLLGQYTELLTTKFKNSNRFIIEIKSAQAALKKVELEQLGATVDDLRRAISEARKDAVGYLLMELTEFLGDQQMVKANKSTKSFMQWGIKQIVTKLKELGLEITENEIREMTVDAVLSRIEKLKDNKHELEQKLAVIEYYKKVLMI